MPSFLSDLDKSFCKQKSHAALLQMLSEHAFAFELNNAVIGAFPLSARRSLALVVRSMPPEAVLMVIGLVVASVLVWLTQSWVDVAPEDASFADPDFVAARTHQT